MRTTQRVSLVSGICTETRRDTSLGSKSMPFSLRVVPCSRPGKYDPRTVGSAEELDEFNAHLCGPIELLRSFLPEHPEGTAPG